MKLVDVTNTNRLLVQSQLDSTDATFVKVYTYGTTTILVTKSPSHIEILYRNKQRQIKSSEVTDTINQLVPLDTFSDDAIQVLTLDGYIELSIQR